MAASYRRLLNLFAVDTFSSSWRTNVSFPPNFLSPAVPSSYSRMTLHTEFQLSGSLPPTIFWCNPSFFPSPPCFEKETLQETELYPPPGCAWSSLFSPLERPRATCLVIFPPVPLPVFRPARVPAGPVRPVPPFFFFFTI